MFHRLSGLLGRAADKLQAREGLRRGRLLLAWREAVGPALARQGAPVDLQGDTLVLLCTGSAWSQEFLLQQSEILERLNRILGDPPLRRLRCRVGRPQPPDPVDSPPGENAVDWEAIPLDAEARLRIERLVSEIRDPDLARRLRRVLIQVERRRTRDIDAGLVPCPACGTLCTRPPCRTCRREARSRRRRQILQRLGREPWLSRPDLLDEFPTLTAAEFAEIRTSLRSRLQRDVWRGLRALEEGSPLPDGLRSLVVELTMLATSLPAHRLRPRHMKASLPRTMARAYLENRAPGPWTPESDKASDPAEETKPHRARRSPRQRPGR